MKIERILKRLGLGLPIVGEPVRLVHCAPGGLPVTFCVNMVRDPIQRAHRQGQFYEQDELERLQTIFPEGGTFVDIGANVGNHTLYAALGLKAGRVIPFEPNQKAYELLVHNVEVNRLRDVVEIGHLGKGLSDSAGSGFGVEKVERNLGGARLLEGTGGLEVIPGDDVLAAEAPDFIKIDVEGMELQVLGGLSETLARCQPILMVEVANDNEPAFRAWAEDAGYVIFDTLVRYKNVKNHLACAAAYADMVTGAFAAAPALEDHAFSE